MAEKRKGKRRRDEEFSLDPEPTEKPSKAEYNIAAWLLKNIPQKKTKFAGHNVEYFTGSKAVDGLLESKWATTEKLFTTRQEIELFLDLMLKHQFFHRAKKVPISDQELKAMKNKKFKKSNDTDKDEKKKTEKKKKEKKDDESEETSKDDKNEDDKNKCTEIERKKKSRKIRLEMHMEQIFVDNLDAYVWIYDPIPFYYWVIGTLIVFGGVGICLFPLWPPQVRMGVQYLSIAAAGLLIFIIVLAILRLVFFSLLWILTAGKLHFWLFPNLTEDVGFFASFWPIYTYNVFYKKNSKKVKKKKDKLSDDEAEDDKKLVDCEEEKKSSESETDEKVAETEHSVHDNTLIDTEPGQSENPKCSEDSSSTDTESSSQQSHTGNDFVMVEKQDAQDT
ncbi:WD40/YVTN repeat-like-containing domain,Translocation protein Sec62 [Cinara cedri]|uniref:Translocation protein SEC62 n=1 Tax=Cinara cedri TaxID=506608 RepID=A0A5E4N0I2_9HEMI|nr:WD40/YVTN repeat-like-containing domain,Translocation protein Sec62 [Cinara cedri]